ncbi:hypothetical protein GLOTRDRAFT_136179 [Gloeophyllum trabeum ATCC 11539]|uniref:Uncharacterized protein n=1 Tax=Gloeophyllum trabeum (strain ATCC 11539 / FP-39264 / Madison 617) TaxID=670483 RepID=S7S0K1_GLOTA|nr:uncharacterized protein GLOTRDRAFT_136179 [Gloeophyllum trabeum ATCC 11539]EPQ59259.1 hypothetical protein GLOTRDRAFT_136179 [Gloeophyllum trabeum ATCC 11539]
MFEDDLQDDVPPPAYEASQQELDRKISLAVQQSLSISQGALGAVDGEEVWEEWDEAAFEAAAARGAAQTVGAGPSSPVSPTRASAPGTGESGGGSGASSSAIQPLRIVKKKKTPSISSAAEEKRKLALVVRNEERQPSAPSYQSSRSGSSVHDRSVHEVPEDDDYDVRSIPPPPFAPAPRVQDVAWRDTDSRIASPLSSPRLEPSGWQAHGPANTQVRPFSLSPSPGPEGSSSSQGLATPRRPYNRPSPRPSTSYTPSSRGSVWNSPAPLVDFNPAVAYTKASTFGKVPMEEEPFATGVNAASLYKSAVQAHMSPAQPTPRRKSVGQTNRSSSASIYGEPTNFPFTPNRLEPLRPQSMLPTPSQYPSYPVNTPPPPRPHLNAANTQDFYGHPQMQHSRQSFQHSLPVTVAGPNRWAVSEVDINRDIYH